MPEGVVGTSGTPIRILAALATAVLMGVRVLNRAKWRPAVHAFGDTDNRINIAGGEVASVRGWMAKLPDVHRHDDAGPEAAPWKSLGAASQRRD